MSDEHHRFEGVVWEEGVERLLAEAVRLFATARLAGEERVLKGLGCSPEDLVYETITKVLENRTVRYRKERGDLLAYLKTVMRNDFRDLLRKAAYKRTEVIDPVDQVKQDAEGEVVTLDSFPGPTEKPPDILWRYGVRRLAADDPELVEYVDAILELELTKPSEIADVLSASTPDILNRRRRLATRIARVPALSRL